MKAMSTGIRVPDGIMAAYPATLLTTDASPSRLLTLIDPLLPLGVLTKCINAYAGTCACRVFRSVLFHTSFNTRVHPGILNKNTEYQKSVTTHDPLSLIIIALLRRLTGSTAQPCVSENGKLPL